MGKTDPTMPRFLFPLVWYPGLAAGGYLLYRYCHVAGDLTKFADGRSPVWDVLSTCFAYLLVEALQLLLTKAAPTATALPEDAPDQREANRNAHVIVAAHQAHGSLTKTLPSVLQAFGAYQVWVADNGRHPCQATERLCADLGVRYRFYDIPNKTYALYKTAKEIYDEHTHVTAVVLLDDDTHLEPTFQVRPDLLEKPLVAGYCVGIAVDKKPPFNVWEQAIDFEYRTISYRNGWKAERGTLHFLHGICAVYDLRRMLTIYSKLCTLPDGLPFGEDSFAGVDCRLAGYRLLQDNANVVTTYCPRRLLPSPFADREQGYGASSLWKQRALRWYLSWPRRLPAEIALGFCYDTGSWVGNVLYRVDLAWYCFLMVVSSMWPVYMARIAVQHQSWAMLGLLHVGLLGTAAATAAIRYQGFPAKLQQGVAKTTFLLVPFMNIAVCALMCASFVLSVLWYIPL